jgi:hypothetical protein
MLWDVARSDPGPAPSPPPPHPAMRRVAAETGRCQSPPVAFPDTRLARTIATTGGDANVQLWDGRRPQPDPAGSAHRSRAPANWLWGLVFSPVGHVLAHPPRAVGRNGRPGGTTSPIRRRRAGRANRSAERSTTCSLWPSLRTGTRSRRAPRRSWPVERRAHRHVQPVGPPLEAHSDRVLAVAFTPDSRALATAGLDGRRPVGRLRLRPAPPGSARRCTVTPRLPARGARHRHRARRAHPGDGRRTGHDACGTQ